MIRAAEAHEGHAAQHPGSHDLGAAAIQRPAGVLFGNLQPSDAGRLRDRARIRAGQPFPVPAERDDPRVSLSVTPICPGQARPGAARQHPRRGGRPPPGIAELRQTCGGSDQRRGVEPDPRPDRLCPRLLHVGGRHRDRLQGDQLLFARARSGHPVE